MPEATLPWYQTVTIYAALKWGFATFASGSTVLVPLYLYGKQTTQAWAQTQIDNAIKASPAIKDIQGTVDALAVEQKQMQDETAATKSDVTIIKEQQKIIIELLKGQQ